MSRSQNPGQMNCSSLNKQTLSTVQEVTRNQSVLSLRLLKTLSARKECQKMTSFTRDKIGQLSDRFSNHVEAIWNSCSGKWKKNFLLDVFFLTLTTVKSGGTWKFLASTFNIGPSVVHKTITEFENIFADHDYATYDVRKEMDPITDNIQSARYAFKIYLYARCATDVVF